MGYIYKITNTINGKVYIGQTARTVEERWKDHIRNYKYKDKRCRHLYRAIEHYGVQYFSIETIEECDYELLNERECFWIKYYNSTDINVGYNLTFGGDGRRKVDYDAVTQLWDNGLSVSEIKNVLGISVHGVRNALIAYAQYSEEESRRRGNKLNAVADGYEVSQYDLDGNYIATFYSASEAARQINISDPHAILNCCKTKHGTSGSYQWRFSNDEPPGKFEGYYNYKKVIQYDKDGNYIQMFNSAAEAARTVGIGSGSILRCCKGKQKSAAGFKWTYADNVPNESTRGD